MFDWEFFCIFWVFAITWRLFRTFRICFGLLPEINHCTHRSQRSKNEWSLLRTITAVQSPSVISLIVHLLNCQILAYFTLVYLGFWKGLRRSTFCYLQLREHILIIIPTFPKLSDIFVFKTYPTAAARAYSCHLRWFNSLDYHPLCHP